MIHLLTYTGKIMNKNFKTTIGRPRDRVLGSGPKRHELPNFKYLCNMPKEIIEEFNNIYYNFSEVNFLKDKENYEIKDKCQLVGMIPEKFQHILLQNKDENMEADDLMMELKYTKFTEHCTQKAKDWLNETFPGLYRARISVLHPGDLFDWHIDTNTSVACRVSCSLNNDDSTFEVKRRGVVDSNKFKVGECWFTNTGWPHRVFNNSDKIRINLLFGIDHKNISKYF